MERITVYLHDDLAATVKRVAKNTGISQSQWIAEAIRQRMRRETWPDSVRALAGAWPDFPSAEEIRAGQLTARRKNFRRSSRQ